MPGESTSRASAPGGAHALLGLALLALSACRTTVDSLGADPATDGGAEPPGLAPLVGPSSYPNAFRDVLGKTDAEIDAKLEQAFQRLFHGDPTLEAIYFPTGADQAYIRDTLHDDIRTEGIGYGMLIAVEIDKREEFDRLWRYARAELEYTAGPNRGYFLSSCDTGSGVAGPCVDPFGHQQLVMALLFAHGRWGSASGGIDYGAAAQALLAVMRAKETENGGVVDGVIDMFDDESKLVFDVPNVSAGEVTRPSIELPGYYRLWAQASGDPFWNEAAASARAHWRSSAHPVTGLWPVRAGFDGIPVPGWDTFLDEGYRTQLNLVVDRVWTGGEAWQLEQSDRLLAFFSAQGIDTYGKSYPLDGRACIDCSREASLIAVNGATALVASVADRRAYIDAVWALEPPSGLPRYYAGLLHLLALLVLSGNLRVY